MVRRRKPLTGVKNRKNGARFGPMRTASPRISAAAAFFGGTARLLRPARVPSWFGNAS